MPVCGSIAQRSVLIQPCDLRLITTEKVDVKCVGGNLSGLGELVIFENVNQTSFVIQVALKTSLEAA